MLPASNAISAKSPRTTPTLVEQAKKSRAGSARRTAIPARWKVVPSANPAEPLWARIAINSTRNEDCSSSVPNATPAIREWMESVVSNR